MKNLKYHIPNVLPFLFYAPLGFFFALSFWQGKPGSITAIQQTTGINGWLIIGGFFIMAILSLLPLGWRWRAWSMLPFGGYILLSTFVVWQRAHDPVLVLQSVYLAFIIIYPVMASIASVNVIMEQNELIERKDKELDFQMKRFNDAMRLFEQHGGNGSGTELT